MGADDTRQWGVEHNPRRPLPAGSGMDDTLTIDAITIAWPHGLDDLDLTELVAPAAEPDRDNFQPNQAPITPGFSFSTDPP